MLNWQPTATKNQKPTLKLIKWIESAHSSSGGKLIENPFLEDELCTLIARFFGLTLLMIRYLLSV